MLQRLFLRKETIPCLLICLNFLMEILFWFFIVSLLGLILIYLHKDFHRLREYHNGQILLRFRIMVLFLTPHTTDYKLTIMYTWASRLHQVQGSIPFYSVLILTAHSLGGSMVPILIPIKPIMRWILG